MSIESLLHWVTGLDGHPNALSRKYPDLGWLHYEGHILDDAPIGLTQVPYAPLSLPIRFSRHVVVARRLVVWLNMTTGQHVENWAE